MNADPSVRELVDNLFRHKSGELVATLTRVFGPEHLDLVEDVVQDALVKALRGWMVSGIPHNPEGWLTRVAKNAALDLLRRDTRLVSRAEEIEIWADRSEDEASEELVDELRDDQLRMIFTACHPTLAPEARIALTLKTLCGFSVGEIARAFLARREAIAQRLVRAKRKLRDERVSFELPPPAEIAARTESVLDVLYLLFNEGYAATEGDALVRHELVAEAVRLAHLVAHEPTTDRPECHALLALMLFQSARSPSRTNQAGELLLLAEQDRSAWDRGAIARGYAELRLAASGERITRFHLEAEIAQYHCLAARYEDTDWREILRVYDQLLALERSPIVELNRAVAVSMVHGPKVGLEAIAALERDRSLERYYLLPAVRGDFLRRLGEEHEAADCFRRALTLAGTEPERQFLRRRIVDVAGGSAAGDADGRRVTESTNDPDALIR